jgi:phage tail-like protein
MPDAGEKETILPPFSGFNFRVELYLGGPSGQGSDQNQSNSRSPLCSASFSECSGLEMSMTPKTIREGGNNSRPIHLLGPVSYGQLSLKRGMTDSLDLWQWFNQVMQKGQGGVRASGQIVMLAADGETEQARFVVEGCLPVKLRAPSLNATDGTIAIEEMQIAYESLRVQGPGGQ